MLPLAQIDMQAFGCLVAYSAAVVLASVFGGLLPEWIRLTHMRMQLMISFVGGIMLGIAVFHMIPHAMVAANGDVNLVAWGLMLGMLATFFLLRFFHFHQHGPADFGIHAEEKKSALQDQATHLCSGHNHPAATKVDDHGCEHHACEPTATDPGNRNARWVAVLVGLGLHTMTDGVAMGSGVVSESGHGHWFPGFGIFLAVLLHKPLDAISITSLMYPVTSPNKRLLVNVGFAFMCPIGAFIFYGLAGTGPNPAAQNIAAWGLAFSAGVFLCIALSDLLPEMEFHSHSRLSLSAALLLGIAAAFAIGAFEGHDAHSIPSVEADSEPARD